MRGRYSNIVERNFKQTTKKYRYKNLGFKISRKQR